MPVSAMLGLLGVVLGEPLPFDGASVAWAYHMRRESGPLRMWVVATAACQPLCCVTRGSHLQSKLPAQFWPRTVPMFRLSSSCLLLWAPDQLLAYL